jgi:hypothetical protein
MLALNHWDLTKLMYLRLEKAQTALNRCPRSDLLVR